MFSATTAPVESRIWISLPVLTYRSSVLGSVARAVPLGAASVPVTLGGLPDAKPAADQRYTLPGWPKNSVRLAANTLPSLSAAIGHGVTPGVARPLTV